MKRNELINEIRSVIKNAEGRGLTADEKQKIAQIEADVAALDEKREIEARAAKLVTTGAEIVDQILTNNVTKHCSEREVRRGMGDVLRGIFGGEVRALQAMTVGTAANGGNTVQDELLNRIIQKKELLNKLWQYANVIPMNSKAMLLPVQGTLTLGMAESEGDALGDGATQNTINQITLTASKIANMVTISNELIEDSSAPIEQYLIDILAKSISRKEEALMIAGTGGLAVATSVSGVAIGTETLGTSSITAADLFEIAHGINEEYRKNAIWLMNDSTVKAVRKLTDAVTGQFLWQPGLQAGQPDMLLGRPVVSSPSVPALAHSARAVVFGDMSYFFVGQRRALEFKRLEELYAANDLIGLIVSERIGFALGLAEAFKVGVCA